MPRFNINHNGQWACFSMISDNFVTNFVDKEEYENWRKEEYGMNDYRPAEECNMLSIEKAVYFLRFGRTYEDTLNLLLWTDLPKEECEKLIYDVETRYFCPIPNDDGTYICPNCKKIITRGQISCDDETCELKFIWR